MSTDELRKEMLAVVESLRGRLFPGLGVEERRRAVRKAERQVERLRKRFKRRVDERALRRPGDQWFSINAREGIEKKLTETTDEALSAIRSLAEIDNIIGTAGKAPSTDQ